MKENFPNLTKERDKQVQEAQTVQNKLDPKRSTPKHIIIKSWKIKDKERILKAAREKQRVTYSRVPIDSQLISQKKLFKQEGTGKKYSKWWKPRTYNQDYSIQKSYHLEWKSR